MIFFTNLGIILFIFLISTFWYTKLVYGNFQKFKKCVSIGTTLTENLTEILVKTRSSFRETHYINWDYPCLRLLMSLNFNWLCNHIYTWHSSFLHNFGQLPMLIFSKQKKLEMEALCKLKTLQTYNYSS